MPTRQGSSRLTTGIRVTEWTHIAHQTLSLWFLKEAQKRADKSRLTKRDARMRPHVQMHRIHRAWDIRRTLSRAERKLRRFSTSHWSFLRLIAHPSCQLTLTIFFIPKLNRRTSWYQKQQYLHTPINPLTSIALLIGHRHHQLCHKISSLALSKHRRRLQLIICGLKQWNSLNMKRQTKRERVSWTKRSTRWQSKR